MQSAVAQYRAYYRALLYMQLWQKQTRTNGCVEKCRLLVLTYDIAHRRPSITLAARL